MRLIAVLPLFALVGCASTQEYLDQAPSEVVSSDKHFLDVANCIGDVNNHPVVEQSDGSRMIAAKSDFGKMGAVYTVRKREPSGSTVEIRRLGGADITQYKKCV